MQSYMANLQYRAEAEWTVLVRSSRCSYWINRDGEGYISISGPGIELEAPANAIAASALDEPEDLAIVATILLENDCWPEEG